MLGIYRYHVQLVHAIFTISGAESGLKLKNPHISPPDCTKNENILFQECDTMESHANKPLTCASALANSYLTAKANRL